LAALVLENEKNRTAIYHKFGHMGVDLTSQSPARNSLELSLNFC